MPNFNGGDARRSPPVEIDAAIPGEPDVQTVTRDGKRLDRFLDGVQLR
ncbi:MAG: hypothetical protein QOG41_702, partial [Thermoleophilaceae bacterium]|nr:hypothetical protein [Thermoleophilaceae bacterium]